LHPIEKKFNKTNSKFLLTDENYKDRVHTHIKRERDTKEIVKSWTRNTHTHPQTHKHRQTETKKHKDTHQEIERYKRNSKIMDEKHTHTPTNTQTQTDRNEKT
jgi:hypothetical protein